MAQYYVGHEFEALCQRFKDQTELLFRLTQIDLQIFTGYITLQVGLGAWIATHQPNIDQGLVRGGLILIDLTLAVISSGLFRNNFLRREEVVATIANCNKALGYEDSGIYLAGSALNAKTKYRPWKLFYYFGVWMGFLGVVLILVAGVTS